MTPQEFRQELKALKKEVGPNAWVSAGITDPSYPDTKGTLDCTVYPHGIGMSIGNFTVYAEDWSELLAAATAKWTACADQQRKHMVRKIALAIIRTTADAGTCTDAALRSEFQSDAITKFGAEALADANKIASNGPFEIITVRGANGAPADAVEINPARLQ